MIMMCVLHLLAMNGGIARCCNYRTLYLNLVIGYVLISKFNGLQGVYFVRLKFETYLLTLIGCWISQSIQWNVVDRFMLLGAHIRFWLVVWNISCFSIS